jgi:serine/threonine protein kinase
MTSRRNRDFELFEEAVPLSLAERGAFLDRACAGDLALRRRVEALLTSNDRAGDFLEEPPTSSIPNGRAKMTAAEQPGDRIGRYKLIREIGEGGCGIVYVAEQEEPIKRCVALKVIKPGMDTKTVIARFEAERQALALMDHPNIAHVFDAGATAAGRPYFVMELVDGEKITDYCNRQSLSTVARLKLFVQVCEAIQHAHQKGIIHRDVKPSNVLVTTGAGGEPSPKVIDFGIAKPTIGQQLTNKTIFTAPEMLIGTPAYMSPEQAALTSNDVDTRTDIYSLGVLLYELLTGTTPFDTKELLQAGFDEIRRVIRDEEPVRPSTRLSTMVRADTKNIPGGDCAAAPRLIRELRGDLDWIAMKALEKDRTRRYETASAFARDIQRYLSGDAVAARPPSKAYRFRKVVQRNRILFGGGAAIASLLIVSLVVVSLLLARTQMEAAKSQQTTKFLEAMLNGVGPSVARGRDTGMLREILDETAERVGKEMTSQPEVEAELRSIMAKLYVQIGEAQKSEQMARRALAIQVKEFGSQSLQAAASLNLLGQTLMVERKVGEAKKVHAEALAIRTRELGTENADTATSLNELAAVYGDEQRLADAEAMVRKSLGVRRRLFGNEAVPVADSLRNLCLIQGAGNRWAEAEQSARDVLAMRRRLLGPEHPSVASAMEDLAWVLNAVNRFEEAQSLDTDALVIRQKLLGDAHPDVPRNLNALGQLLGNRGELEAASGVLKAVLAIQRKLLGDENEATVETFCILAKALQRENRGRESEAVWREVLAIGGKAWAEDHKERLYALRGLAESLESQGKWPEAEALWRQSLSLWRKRGGKEEQQSMYTLRRLGLALEAAHKWPEAEMFYREALAISRKRGDEDSEALVDLDRVVRALTAQTRFAEAQQLLDTILTPAFVSKPTSANLLVERVNLMGRRGRWQEAAADAALLLENQLTDHYHYHTLAALLAMIRNRPAYEQICKRLVTKFADTPNPYIAERMAQDCMLLPDWGADLVLMERLADRAVTAGSSENALPYFQACKSMSAYRLGNYSQSIDWANKATATNSSRFAQAKAFAVQAMAHWRLGESKEAQAALGKGDELVPRISAERGVDDLGESWVAWLMARISLDEATTLIQAGLPKKEI